MKWHNLFLLFIFPALVFAQKIDTVALKRELAEIYKRDQTVRNTCSRFTHREDSINLSRIEKLIKKYGWPGKSFVGDSGNLTVFLVIQHSNLQTQEKYFPKLKASVEKNESPAMHLAYIQDRILTSKGQKQIYGTQVWEYYGYGTYDLLPIEDEKNVNIRRAKVGLEPLEEYAKKFGIDYKLPKQ